MTKDNCIDCGSTSINAACDICASALCINCGREQPMDPNDPMTTKLLVCKADFEEPEG